MATQPLTIETVAYPTPIEIDMSVEPVTIAISNPAVTIALEGSGPPGHGVLSGHGAPAAGTGTDGDFYLDIDTMDMYGPKASGAWGAPVSLDATHDFGNFA